MASILDQQAPANDRKQQPPFDEEKLGRIRDCLSQEPVSLWDLRELALSKGGLLNGKLVELGRGGRLVFHAARKKIVEFTNFPLPLRC